MPLLTLIRCNKIPEQAIVVLIMTLSKIQHLIG